MLLISGVSSNLTRPYHLLARAESKKCGTAQGLTAQLRCCNGKNMTFDTDRHFGVEGKHHSYALNRPTNRTPCPTIEALRTAKRTRARAQ